MSLHHGDCLDVMADMDPESVDAIVTDPPYGLEFMGKEWDKPWAAHFSAIGNGRPMPDRQLHVNPRCRSCGGYERGTKRRCSCAVPDWSDSQGAAVGRTNRAYGEWSEAWAREAFRVAKPSAYLLAFGGTRTVHRMTCAIEDAGWIVRDMLVWVYASGFPKSKASLKPAWEPIVMARKPGPLRMLAVDACRLPTTEAERAWMEATAHPNGPTVGWGGNLGREGHRTKPQFEAPKGGRWPANVLLSPTGDGLPDIFDGGVEGVVGGGETSSGSRTGQYAGSGSWSGEYGPVGRDIDGDSGTYSRFFLVPKADRADREPVLGGGPERVVSVWGGDEDDLTPGKKSTVPRANVHPTVKPTDLMRHLVRLVTPTGGIVLDPFLGSGTTAIAAEMEGFAWVGIEREAEYVAIAEARLNGVQRGLGLETA